MTSKHMTDLLDRIKKMTRFGIVLVFMAATTSYAAWELVEDAETSQRFVVGETEDKSGSECKCLDVYIDFVRPPICR